jgi:hypothetical protein
LVSVLRNKSIYPPEILFFRFSTHLVKIQVLRGFGLLKTRKPLLRKGLRASH